MTRSKLVAVGTTVAVFIPPSFIGAGQAHASDASYATSLSQLIGPDGPPQGPNNTAAASAAPEGTPALPVAALGSEPAGVEFHPTTAPAGVNPLSAGCVDLKPIRNVEIGGSNNYIGNYGFGLLAEGVGYVGADEFVECNYLGADYLSDLTINPNDYVEFINVSGSWVLDGGATSGHEDFFNGLSGGGEFWPCWDDITGWDGAQVHDPAPGGIVYSEVLVGAGALASDQYTGLMIGNPWSDVGLCKDV
ncbi:MAG: hypothetical protein M0Z30_19615 [Actinomycetota bacterium]|nr:hypothetical protein [Actinomycetota bacterium]